MDVLVAVVAMTELAMGKIGLSWMNKSVEASESVEEKYSPRCLSILAMMLASYSERGARA